jgi:uncharacterized C2H2 Zn-finger protein
MLYRYFKCPECGRVGPAGEWNAATLRLCNSRYLRRNFKKIEASGLNGKNWYECPHCQAHVQSGRVQGLMKSEV